MLTTPRMTRNQRRTDAPLTAQPAAPVHCPDCGAGEPEGTGNYREGDRRERELWKCAECGHEWVPDTRPAPPEGQQAVIAEVVAELNEALQAGALFNPEMFGSMLKRKGRGFDNPILRWRDALLSVSRPPSPDGPVGG